MGPLIDLPKAPDAIELRHLRAFVAVAEELNFSRAAERLYMTQPALSRLIRTLERLVGVDLLRRSTRQVELTIAGEALLNRVRPMLTDLDEAVVTTQFAGGAHNRKLERLTQPVIDKMLEGLDEFRAAFEAMTAQFPSPEGVSVRPAVAGGVQALVYGEEPALAPTAMYVHGGGFLSGSAFGSRPMAGIFAAAMHRSVLVPDFRLAPEHPYPAPVDDVAAAYAWFAARTEPHERILIADSSGCSLVLSLLQRVRAADGPMPTRIVLLSPWVDMECKFLDQQVEGDPTVMTIRDQLDMCVPTYLGEHRRDDPAVNALHADLSGLPPMLVQVGTGDCVLAECRELVARAQDHGVAAELELYPVNTHVFHLFWSFLPEAAKAIERAAVFAGGGADSVSAPVTRTFGS